MNTGNQDQSENESKTEHNNIHVMYTYINYHSLTNTARKFKMQVKLLPYVYCFTNASHCRSFTNSKIIPDDKKKHP